MISLFRKIRKKLAEEKKFKQYLRYAIGEIILVVVGILIALQINTWNQDRISNNEEKAILKNIYTEFSKNKLEIDESVISLSECIKTNKVLMSLFGINYEELKKEQTDSLIFYSFEQRRFTPSENAIQDLIQSGKMRSLNNENLKYLIYEWSSRKDAMIESYNDMDDKINNSIVPFLADKYPLKDIDIYSNIGWGKRSTLNHDKLTIFHNLEYESLVDDFLYHLLEYETDLINLQQTIDKIIIETK
ncbi:DUF6090 family protein [Urechidicola vernalis]|uniref:DUF6090 family protein n=1 Tax=Urechidicola vernalis TaxID=3075600 RepID=A0ABU2Y3E2_9FLAO|nr:DUF6090 family protein [Urechidicola sp. P050]MDT0551770.1 DUF6090 family protein [Urechidicola sp. P050]